MWLPGDHVVYVDGQPVELRPTLKAAMRLHRGYDGLEKLADALVEGKLSACRDVLSEGGSKGLPKETSVRDIEKMTPKLVAFVNALAGGDIPESNRPKGAPVSVEEFHASLYKIGTGWLGWTPRDTLSSTIGQIMGAYEGRIEQLQAIFGSSEEAARLPTPEELPFKIDAILSTMPGRRFVRRDGKLEELH